MKLFASTKVSCENHPVAILHEAVPVKITSRIWQNTCPIVVGQQSEIHEVYVAVPVDISA